MARANKYTSLNFNDIYEKKIINPNNNNNSSSSRSPSSSSSISSHKSYSLSASSRLTHGGMLLLSRPSPQPQPTYTQKPQPQPQPQPQPLAPSQQSTLSSEAFPAITSPPPSKPTDSDSISLRPKGKTGGNPSFQERDIKLDAPSPNPSPSPSPSPSPKSSKFVPPHLRPGFVAKEVPSVPDFQKPRQGNYRHGSVHGNYHGSPNRYTEDGRPNSGGGYERKMRGAALGPGPGPGPVAGSSPVGAESDSFLMNRPRSGGSRPSSSGCLT